MSSATELQRRFAAGIARGLSGAQAAREAGYRGTSSTLAPLASKLRRKPHVAALIKRLRAEAMAAPTQGTTAADLAKPPGAVASSERLTLERKLELLAGIATSAEARDADRIRAIELHARLDGELGAGRELGPSAEPAATAVASAQVVVVVDNGRGPGG